MLGHRLCDLAFCSYAWSEPAALNLRNLTLPSVALPHRAPAQRIVQAALEESLMEELSMEEKQAAFGMRRSAGRWAEVISAKDFLRFFICAHLAAEGLQLMQLFGSKVTSVDAEVWKRISWGLWSGRRWLPVAPKTSSRIFQAGQTGLRGASRARRKVDFAPQKQQALPLSRTTSGEHPADVVAAQTQTFVVGAKNEATQCLSSWNSAMPELASGKLSHNYGKLPCFFHG